MAPNTHVLILFRGYILQWQENVCVFVCVCVRVRVRV